MAQIGTKHGHAHGKWRAMQTNPDIELASIFEPDPQARAAEQQRGVYGADARWCESADEILGDDSIVAVAIEGRNAESLAMARQAIDAGKHIWYDKPAGDDLDGVRSLVDEARKRGLLIQMGYMFRYQPGFQQAAQWVKSGLLGEITSIRAHMSTNIPIRAAEPHRNVNTREGISCHRGGILYDLGGHMLDQIVWLLGRPVRVSAVLRNDATPEVPDFMDNTLGVFEFERALAFVDISATEPRPMARRFEVYGTRGSAILEPFDPCRSIRLCLEEAAGDYSAGEHIITPPIVERQEMYARELVAFIATVRGEQSPDRSLDHELLVQETLLRATRGLG
jgi:predicted dehydrogenase